jgi:sugar O-acyltransferase (sialic acid O-acetyltransferase NeuD family)
MSHAHAVAPPPPGTVCAIIGAGGIGRVIMAWLADALAHGSEAHERRLVFVVEGAPASPEVNGYPLLSLGAFLALEAPRRFTVGIGDGRVRERIAGICLGAGIEPMTIVSRHAVIFDGDGVGVGAVFGPFSSVSVDATIGRFFQAHSHAHVSHDCAIGDFVTFASAVQCLGHVTVGDHAFLGAGALIRQGAAGAPLRIGEGAVVGMGAVVLEDVEPHTTVVGNPARPLRR